MIFSRTLTLRFEDALEYAVQKHRNQKRKGTRIPYVAHLLGAASIALLYGADEDQAIAALLHDAVEDQGGERTSREISRRYGETVVAIVHGCTDADRFPKPPWRKRKEEYIAQMKCTPAPVLLVSAADKLDNVRSILKDQREIGDKVWARFKGKKEGTLWYYREMVKAFRSAKHAAVDKRLTPLFDELARAVSDMETAAKT
jgi:(p)ppGpp synthase/HD superfamily hydrolase